MTLQEFKAWFDGYTEGMDSTPNAKQWDRIKSRVKEIDDKPITREIYVERYRHYPYYIWNGWNGPTGTVTLLSGSTCTTAGGIGSVNGISTIATNCASGDGFNSSTALFGVGRSDAIADAA